MAPPPLETSGPGAGNGCGDIENVALGPAAVNQARTAPTASRIRAATSSMPAIASTVLRIPCSR